MGAANQGKRKGRSKVRAGIGALRHGALKPGGDFWLGRDGKAELGGMRILLLEKIAETGTLTRAAKAAGISYRTAWTLLEEINGISHRPLVASSTGGARGGGSRLTEHGKELLDLFHTLQREHSRYLSEMRAKVKGFARLSPAVRRLTLSTSARNQLHGEVQSIQWKGLQAEVVLRIGGRGRVRASITLPGLEALGLRPGDSAYALIKANWVTAALLNRPAGSSGLNRLRGRVLSVREEDGALECVLRLPGGACLVSTQSVSGPAAAGLKEGRHAEAVFAPENVILGVAS